MVSRMSEAVKCKLCPALAIGCDMLVNDPYCLEHMKRMYEPEECAICKKVFPKESGMYQWDGELICVDCLQRESRDLMIENYEWARCCE